MQVLPCQNPDLQVIVCVKDGIIMDTIAYRMVKRRFQKVEFPDQEVAGLLDEYSGLIQAVRVNERMTQLHWEKQGGKPIVWPVTYSMSDVSFSLSSSDEPASEEP